MMSGQMPVSQNGMSSCGTIRPQTPKTHGKTLKKHHVETRAFMDELENPVHPLLNHEINIVSSHKKV